MKAIAAAVIGLIMLIACATAVPQVSILNVSTQVGNLTPTNLNGYLIGNGTFVSIGQVSQSGGNVNVQLGDNFGATNLSIRNYNGGQVASIDSRGNAKFLNISIGNYSGDTEYSEISMYHNLMDSRNYTLQQQNNPTKFPDLTLNRPLNGAFYLAENGYPNYHFTDLCTGEIGIGLQELNPQYQFHVNNRFISRWAEVINTSTYGLMISNVTSAGIGANDTTGVTEAAFVITNKSDNRGNIFGVHWNSFVGINQPAPVSLLHIKAGSTDASQGIRLEQSSGTTNYVIYPAFGDLIFATAGSTIAKFQSTNFQVTDGGTVSALFPRLSSGRSYFNSNVSVGRSDGTAQFDVDQSVRFRNYTNGYLYVDNGGNVTNVSGIAAINESYAYLPGRPGGQTLNGGTNAGDVLRLNGSTAGGNIVLGLGDDAGATNISIRNYSNGQVASIDSLGHVNITGINILGYNSSINVGSNADSQFPFVRVGYKEGNGTAFNFSTRMGYDTYYGVSYFDNLNPQVSGGVGDINIRSANISSPYELLSRIFIDRSSGFIGFNTISPQNPLEIVSDSFQIKNTRLSNPNQYTIVYYAGFRGSATNDLFLIPGSGYGLDLGSNGGTTKAYISSAGNFGIKTGGPTVPLDVNGDARFRNCSGTPYMNATGYMFCISDESKKQGIKSYTTGLDAIHAITPISWTAGYSAGETLTGFSYQDVKKTLPSSVTTHIVTKEVDDKTKAPDSEGKYPQKEIPTGETWGTVDLSGMVATLWNAMQQEDAKVTAMQTTIDAQQKQIDELKARLDKAGIKP